MPSGLMARELSVVGALARPARGEGPVELAALARETVSAEVARRALLLDIRHLPPPRRRPAQMALLREAFDPLRRSARIRVFDMPNGDVVAVAPPPAPQLDETRARLLALLDPGEAKDAITDLRLPDEAAALLAAVERALGLQATARQAEEARPGLPALVADGLAAAEQRVAAADIEALVRREWVCRIVADGTPEPVWEERRVRLEAVAESLLPGQDLDAAPWLRRRLRRTLDRRLIAAVTRAEEMRGMRALALPLALESATGPEFLRLDALLPVALRGALTVLVEAAELLADPDAAALARRWLGLRGHRLGIELAAPEAAALFPPARSGHQALRLTWSEALPGIGSEAAETLRKALAVGPGQVVLAGVDRPAAIAWGWEMGISLFQGRLVEQRRPVV